MHWPGMRYILAHFCDSDKWRPEEEAYQSSAHVCPLRHSHSWLILQGTCVSMQHLLALTPVFGGRPELQLSTVVTRQCLSGGIALLLFESKERDFVVRLSGMLVFSP